MKVNCIEDIINGVSAFMPSGLMAEISMDNEGNILVKYQDETVDTYTQDEFGNIIKDGIDIFMEPSQMILENVQNYVLVKAQDVGNDIEILDVQKGYNSYDDVQLAINDLETDYEFEEDPTLMLFVGYEKDGILYNAVTDQELGEMEDFAPLQENKIHAMVRLEKIAKCAKNVEDRQQATSLLDAMNLGADVKEDVKKFLKKIEKEFKKDESLSEKLDNIQTYYFRIKKIADDELELTSGESVFSVYINPEDDLQDIRYAIEDFVDGELASDEDDADEITGTEVVGFKYNIDSGEGEFEANIFFNEDLDESLNEISDKLTNRIEETVNTRKLFAIDHQIAVIENQLMKIRSKINKEAPNAPERLFKDRDKLEYQLKVLKQKREKILNEEIDIKNLAYDEKTKKELEKQKGDFEKDLVKNSEGEPMDIKKIREEMERFLHEISDEVKGKALGKRIAQARAANRKFRNKYPDNQISINKKDPRAAEWLKDSDDAMEKTRKARRMYGKVVSEAMHKFVVNMFKDANVQNDSDENLYQQEFDSMQDAISEVIRLTKTQPQAYVELINLHTDEILFSSDEVEAEGIDFDNAGIQTEEDIINKDVELEEAFTDEMSMLTDINDLDFPQALADTVDTTEEGEVLTLGKVADQITDLKDEIKDAIEDIKDEVKDGLQDIKQDIQDQQADELTDDELADIEDVEFEDEAIEEEPEAEQVEDEQVEDTEDIEDEQSEDEQSEDDKEEKMEESVNESLEDYDDPQGQITLKDAKKQFEGLVKEAHDIYWQGYKFIDITLLEIHCPAFSNINWEDIPELIRSWGYVVLEEPNMEEPAIALGKEFTEDDVRQMIKDFDKENGLDESLNEERDLKTVWAQEMKREPVIRLEDEVIYVQPDYRENTIKYGPVTDIGMLPYGEIPFDSTRSLDWHLQEIRDSLMNGDHIFKEGYKKYIKRGYLEDLAQTKREIDTMTQQGKSAKEIKDTITIKSDDEKEQEEAENYAVSKLKEQLLNTSKTSKIQI